MQQVLATKAAAGATAAELPRLKGELGAMKIQYANTLANTKTFAEIAPWEAVMALVTTAILRNSRAFPLPLARNSRARGSVRTGIQIVRRCVTIMASANSIDSTTAAATTPLEMLRKPVGSKTNTASMWQALLDVSYSPAPTSDNSAAQSRGRAAPRYQFKIVVPRRKPRTRSYPPRGAAGIRVLNRYQKTPSRA